MNPTKFVKIVDLFIFQTLLKAHFSGGIVVMPAVRNIIKGKSALTGIKGTTGNIIKGTID